jgi:penicillin-binding protein 2
MAFAAPAAKKANSKSTPHRAASAKKPVAKASTRAKNAKKKKPAVKKATYTRKPARKAPVRRSPWTAPTYADSTLGDNVDGEDLEVRRAAVEALGPFNGSVVVVDTETGRILSMVNQKLALGTGFQPCSTIKVPAALAALSEGLIDQRTAFSRMGRHTNLTQAMATSSNPYFGNLGVKMGYSRFAHYARLFGYGEKAGLNIPGEQPGRFPAAPPKNGGMWMLTSFGEDISQTPLQLAALMSALANGGTLYYLQYPADQREVARFVPRVKRHLNIKEYLPVVLPGMLGAVEFGTARRAQQDKAIAGKTGTCTDSRTHMGWFGSFNNSGERKLAVVVMLTGGGPAIGPQAAGIAGNIYRNLARQEYFAKRPAPLSPLTPVSLITTQICCTVP